MAVSTHVLAGVDAFEYLSHSLPMEVRVTSRFFPSSSFFPQAESNSALTSPKASSAGGTTRTLQHYLQLLERQPAIVLATIAAMYGLEMFLQLRWLVRARDLCTQSLYVNLSRQNMIRKCIFPEHYFTTS